MRFEGLITIYLLIYFCLSVCIFMYFVFGKLFLERGLLTVGKIFDLRCVGGADYIWSLFS